MCNVIFFFYKSKYFGIVYTHRSICNRSSDGPNRSEKELSIDLHTVTSIVVIYVVHES